MCRLRPIDAASFATATAPVLSIQRLVGCSCRQPSSPSSPRAHITSATAAAAANVSASIELNDVEACFLDVHESAPPCIIKQWPVILGPSGSQLASDSATLAWNREAEIKHARLAMLAAVGWPVAEKLNGPLSASLQMESLLVDGRSPSVLNGGLGAVSVVYWLVALGLAAAIENSTLNDQLGVKKTTCTRAAGPNQRRV